MVILTGRSELVDRAPGRFTQMSALISGRYLTNFLSSSNIEKLCSAAKYDELGKSMKEQSL